MAEGLVTVDFFLFLKSNLECAGERDLVENFFLSLP